MKRSPAQFFCGDDFTCGGFHQGRSAQEDGSLFVDDDGFVSHGGHVCTTGGTRSHDRGELWDPSCRHGGLVVEDAAKVFTVGEHVVLIGQVRSPGVHEVDAWEFVFTCDFLCAQVFFDGHGVVRTAFDRGVVGHDHADTPVDQSHTGDDAGTRRVVVVHAIGC